MKVKFFNFKSLVTYVTIVAFYFATTLSAQALPLRPISLAQMYSLASQGNVRALRAAVQRGMNIDATDRYGNTGLCHSIYQNNYTAYNAFHASGANPRHPCIQNIPPEQYDYFMASSRATPITATPRDAYKEFADGEFVFSTTTWVIGGLLLAGGIAALVLSGDDDDKNHHYFFPQDDTFTPTDDSLGALVGTKTPDNPTTPPYDPVKFDKGVNTEDFTLDNDSQILVDGEQKNLSEVIDFGNSVLEYTPYLQVAMKAIDGEKVVNGQTPLSGSDVGTTITLKNNTAGLVALHNADAINNNTLKIIAKNGTIGMIASDNSLAQNVGNIDISFQGTASTDQVIGMYADTSSSAVNDGTITGNVISENSAGTLIGMEGRLINQVQNPTTTAPSLITNNGKITLNVSAAPSQTISTSLVGMGTYLENDFLTGSKLVRRTGNIDMTNNGQINLNVNLGDSGSYDSSQVNLYDGTGGIIGMRADAHTNAVNNGAINLTIAPESASSVTNAHAGMLSVHGGSIKNNQSIFVEGGIGGYGMLGIRGSGTNSEFNTLNPTLLNEVGATITVNSVDGFGMATRHGGTVTNKGNIIMGEKSTGLQVNAGTGTNEGLIRLNNSGTGMAIRKNTASEEGTVNNSSTASITNSKGATITIHKANGASGMFIEDGTAINNGTININGTASATTTESSYGIQAENGKISNTGTINVDVLMSGDAQSYGIYGGNAATVDNSGNIIFAQKGIGTYTTSGTNTNSGSITMNGIGSTGMSSDSGAILNTGTISLVSGTGIQSNTGQVTNQGEISITNGTGSIGISSSSDILNEKDAKIEITGANSTGILIGENGSATNNGDIILQSNQDSTENYGIKSEGGADAFIINNGNIVLNGYKYAKEKEIGYGMYIATGEAVNNKSISINDMYGYGMSSDSGMLTNNDTIDLSNGGYGIKSNTGSVFNSQGATITITNTNTQASSYGIAVETGTAQNSGTINVSGNSENTNNSTYGIFVNGGNGINLGSINMYADNAYGLYDAAGGDITNNVKLGQISEINLFGNKSVGMQTTSGTAQNFGTINVGVQDEDGVIHGGNESTAMASGEEGHAYNTGIINLNGNDSIGMFTDGGSIQNTLNGVINVNGSGNTVFKTSNGGQAYNYGTIVINTDDYELFTTTDEDGGNFTNEGIITANSSNSQVITAGDGSTINNSGNINLNGNNSYVVYVKGTGSATNSGTITIDEGSNNSYGLYIDDTATGSAINNTNANIIVNGENSSGMYIASATSTEGITNKGKITVSGDGSIGMGSSANAKVTNSGTIDMQGGSAAIKASGGTITNSSSGNIITSETSGANGIAINAGTGSATVTNDGKITINGSGNGIIADSANITNNGEISVNTGAGINLSKGEVSNKGVITVSGDGGSGIVSGGTATNNEDGEIYVTGNSAKGMNITTGGTGTNNSQISVDGNSASGIYVSGGNGSNSGTISVSGNGATGLYVSNGTGTNNSQISVDGENAFGMKATQGTATNEATINVNEESAAGLFADGGNVENSSSGVLTLTTSGSVGILVNRGSGTNSGTIDLSKQGTIGLQANGGKATNEASLTVNGSEAIGLFANGGNVENKATITVSNGGKAAIEVAAGSGTNSGTIDVSASDASGILVTGGSATNSNAINVSGTVSSGMSVSGGTAINSGKISVTGTNAVGMSSSDSGSATNSNTINVSVSNGIGMFADGGNVTNGKDINLNTSGAEGMVANTGGNATNNGTITATTANTLAMHANGGKITNGSTGKISGSTTSQYLMLAENGGSANNQGSLSFSGTGAAMQANAGSTAQNSGTITVTGSSGSGMIANGAVAKATNNGTIDVQGGSGYAMFAQNGGTVTNAKTIKYAGTNAAMKAASGSEAINNGTITVTSGVNAMVTDGGTLTNNADGVITLSASGAKGMVANTGGNATNNGTITATTANTLAMYANGGKITNGSTGKISGSTSSQYLMLAENGGSANNQGSLSFDGTGAAMQANAGSTAQNSGTISVTNSNGKGMVASSTGAIAKVTNLAGGVINISGSNGVGMYADGTGAQAVNLGTINVNTTSSTAYGMKAVNGGSVENAGTINMTSGAQGIGIYVGSGSNFYNNASGKIVFAGGATQSGTITADTSSGDVTICESEDSCNNKFIYLAQNAKLVNSGTMVSASSFALNEMGDGEVVLTSTGKMEAADSITGNLYVTSDSAMLAQGQKDVYVNENALAANKIDVALMSKSPMWNVSFQDSTEETNEVTDTETSDELDSTDSSSDTDHNQKQNIVYNRVGFDKLVSNASQAAYLETNYAIRNSIYDGMIVASSQGEFNRAVQEGLGLDLIPNFAKQNMDIMRNVNRQINSAVFNNADEAETRTTIGYDFFDREQDGNNGLSGYEDEAHSGYALWDRKYNENFRYGIGASFTKYDSDYDNGSERNEIIAQIMTPLLFEAGNTQFLSMPKIGMGWGEYTRYAQGKEYKADTRNYYYGINNEVRHDVDMGIVTLEPVAEFNVLGFYQNRTKENIRIESNNNVSVEGGLGLYAKKSFSLTGEDELKIRLGGTYYHEFNNPYQAPKAGVVGLIGSYQMDSYEAQKDRAVLSARFDYKRGKFNFYLEGNSYVEDDDTYSINAGLTYAF